jgi:hypothetical protein
VSAGVDELRARSAAADIQALTGKTVCIFRPREINLEDADAVSREQERQRLSILASLNQPDIAPDCTGIGSSTEIDAVSRFRSHCITVPSVNQSILINFVSGSFRLATSGCARSMVPDSTHGARHHRLCLLHSATKQPPAVCASRFLTPNWTP